MTKKYRALRFIAVLLRILAWIVLVVGVLSAIGALIAGFVGGGESMWQQFGVRPMVSGVVAGLVVFFTVLFWAAVDALALFAAADYIVLFMDIEANTRATAHYLAEINRQYQAPMEE